MKTLMAITGILFFTLISFGQCPKRCNYLSPYIINYYLSTDTINYTKIIRDIGPTLYFKEKQLIKMKSHYIGAWGESFKTVVKAGENEYEIYINENIVSGGYHNNKLCCYVVNDKIKSCFNYKLNEYLIELDSLLIVRITRDLEEFIFYYDKYLYE